MADQNRTEVVHRPERARYELHVDGEQVGVADYRELDSGALLFPHTAIDPSHRGQGLGEVLVRGALDDVRNRGGRVIPQCWYVADFIRANPEYQDLRAA